jgi:nucleotidyltransferase substrate binding protein (TIGR01987 family)
MKPETHEFARALKTLSEGLALPKTDITRDACIQRFEFCVDLAWKSAKKLMGTTSTAPKTVVREMAQNGLISDVSFWLQAIDQRNLSSHTYKEEVANEVYAFSQSFLPAAKTLLEKLNSL